MEGTHFSFKSEEPKNISNRSNYMRSTSSQFLAFSYETNNSNNLAPGDVVHVNDDPNHESEVLLHKDYCGRDMLKRLGEEVAGRVIIPDTWGQENLLEEWMDYSSFDKLLAPNGIASAREALVAEGRRASSSQLLRIQSRC